MILSAMWIMGGFSTADWTDESNQADAFFGWSVASAGDVNGDGYADAIVGSYLFDAGHTDEGRATVYHGSAAGLDLNAAWTGEVNQIAAQYGFSAASAGDVNSDGYDDVIVGANIWDNGQTDEGGAWVYHGSATGLATVAAWTGEVNQASALFGYTVASAGDVNGDGFDDVIVGAPLYDNGSADEGRAFAYHGSATGLETVAAWSTESNQNIGNYGFWVAPAGDVNSDGFDDVIVGAPFFDNGDSEEGRASLYMGSATGLSTVADWSFEANAPFQYVGWSVASAGDVNADGFDDVVVGSLYWDSGGMDGGAGLVFLGTATGLEITAEFVVDSPQAISYFGSTVAPAGDVDGDGYDDILVGAPFYDNGQNDEGRAYLFAGTCADPNDSDGDEVGDLCDVCPGFDDRVDADIDGLADDCDVCPTLYDPMQLDDDTDGIGDACDPCPANSPDADDDGFCAAQECDDNNPTVYPGAYEECDGLDTACSGTVPADELDEDGDGEPICAGDCDDANPALFSGQTETCNGLDDNCDGDLSADELDADEDHVTVCGGDCDDNSDRASPELFDICGDAVDNDCDGEIDQTCGADEETSTGCACNGTSGAGAPFLALATSLVLVARRRSRRQH